MVNVGASGEDVARTRVQVDRLCWSAITLGLAFTMTNVQQFAAAGAAVWSLPWLAAWLLDPTVSVALVAVLRAEQVAARYRVRTGVWVRRAKWFTLAATYVMNTWASYTAGSVSGIVLHSVPPLLVFVAAEAVTDLRDALTRAVTAATTVEAVSVVGAPTGPADSRPAVGEAVSAGVVVPGGVHEPVAAAGVGERQEVRRRTSAGEYLARARSAWEPGVVVTPAWVREVTGCSRGLSSRLAAELSTEVTAMGAAAAGEAPAQDGSDGGGRS